MFLEANSVFFTNGGDYLCSFRVKVAHIFIPSHQGASLTHNKIRLG